MNFCTVLQYPLNQVAIVNGSEISYIPETPPKTPARKVMACGEYNGRLAIARTTSLELWDLETRTQLRHLYHPYICGVHKIIQFGNEMLIVNANLDSIILIDWDGKVSWEWWGWKNGFGPEIKELKNPQWMNIQVSEIGNKYSVLHLNSGTYMPDSHSILTSAAKTGAIISVPIDGTGYRLVKQVEKGAHTPVFMQGTLVYGKERGICYGDKSLFSEKPWVKTILPLSDGFAFTCDKGVFRVNRRFEIVDRVKLPPCYLLSYFK
jgi:hypothetical protein